MLYVSDAEHKSDWEIVRTYADGPFGAWARFLITIVMLRPANLSAITTAVARVIGAVALALAIVLAAIIRTMV